MELAIKGHFSTVTLDKKATTSKHHPEHLKKDTSEIWFNILRNTNKT